MVGKSSTIVLEQHPSLDQSIKYNYEAMPRVLQPDLTLAAAAAAAASAPSVLVEPLSNDNSPEQQLVGWRFLCVETCLLLGLLLSVMETSIVATALVTIAEEFGDFLRVQWVVLAYLLSYMGFSVIITKSSDVVGRKWTMVACLLAFSTFSLASGLAKTMNQLIVFRALQGIGGSGMFAMCMVAMPEITPPRHFAAMSGGIGATFATSSVLGPLFGGVISKSNWRWIFLLNVPAALFILTLLVISWRGPGRQVNAEAVSLAQVDYLGGTLLLAGSVLIVFALQEGGSTTFLWSSPTIIGTFVVGGACALTLILWTWFLASRKSNETLKPILPLAMFQKRVLVVVLISTFLTGYSFFTVLIELPERFQIVNRESPVLAGVHLLPLLAASALGSFLGGACSSKKDNTLYTLNVASCFMLLGCGLLSTISDRTAVTSTQYGYQVIFGFGVGLTFSTVTVMTIFWTNPSEVAAAQGVVSQARIFGGSVGLSVATIILNNRITRDLKGLLTEKELQNLRQSLSTIRQLDEAQEIAVVQVFAKSFNSQLRLCTYIAGICLVVSLCACSKDRPLKSAQKMDGIDNAGKNESCNIEEV